MVLYLPKEKEYVDSINRMIREEIEYQRMERKKNGKIQTTNPRRAR